MSRICLACAHPQRNAIDLALLLHKQSYRRIAAHYGLTEACLRRHQANHLAMSWELSKGLQAVLSANNLLAKLGEWHEKMEHQYTKADAANEIMAAVATARVGINAIESFAKITLDADLAKRLDALEAQLNANANASKGD